MSCICDRGELPVGFSREALNPSQHFLGSSRKVACIAELGQTRRAQQVNPASTLDIWLRRCLASADCGELPVGFSREALNPRQHFLGSSRKVACIVELGQTPVGFSREALNPSQHFLGSSRKVACIAELGQTPIWFSQTKPSILAKALLDILSSERCLASADAGRVACRFHQRSPQPEPAFSRFELARSLASLSWARRISADESILAEAALDILAQKVSCICDCGELPVGFTEKPSTRASIFSVRAARSLASLSWARRDLG